MGQHGILYVKEVATLFNASMDVSSQQLKHKENTQLMWSIARRNLWVDE